MISVGCADSAKTLAEATDLVDLLAGVRAVASRAAVVAASEVDPKTLPAHCSVLKIITTSDLFHDLVVFHRIINNHRS